MNKLICAVTLLAVSSAQADTIFVDDDAPLGGDGLSWATAYRFLQDALDTASNHGRRRYRWVDRATRPLWVAWVI